MKEFCPNCGKEVEPGTPFCPRCGADLRGIKDVKSPKGVEGAKEFCPNCGKEVKKGTTFCPYCGAKLSKVDQPTANQQANIAASNPQSATPPSTHMTRKPVSQQKPPMDNRKKILIAVIAAVVVILGGLFAFGQNYYSMPNQVGRIADDIRNQDNNKLASVVMTDDPKIKITPSSVKPLSNYYTDNYDSLDNLKNTLAQGGSTNGIHLAKDGSYFLIFPKYKLNVESYKASITTNHANSRVYVDGKFVKTAADNGDGSYTAKIGPYIGGKYNVQVKSKTSSGHELASDANISLWQQDRDYNYNIKTANLAILGPNGGQVYIGSRNVGKIAKGALDIKDFQYNDESSAYVVYKVNGNKFTSKEANISQAVEDSKSNSDGDSDSDDPLNKAKNATNDFDSAMVNIYPEFKGAPSKGTLESLLNDCFKSPSSDDFIDGSDNKYYKSFDKLADDFNNSDKIESWDIQPDVVGAYPIGGGVFEADVKIDYKFEHESDTHIQVAHYPHVTFKEDDGTFKILSVGEGKIIYDKTEDN